MSYDDYDDYYADIYYYQQRYLAYCRYRAKQDEINRCYNKWISNGFFEDELLENKDQIIDFITKSFTMVIFDIYSEGVVETVLKMIAQDFIVKYYPTLVIESQNIITKKIVKTFIQENYQFKPNENLDFMNKIKELIGDNYKIITKQKFWERKFYRSGGKKYEVETKRDIGWGIFNFCLPLLIKMYLKIVYNVNTFWIWGLV